jgi:MOSC domain-containing protein YiiM
VAGDRIGAPRDHGGADQAVYAYAREDLDGWERILGRSLPSGCFGENLTTTGVDVTGARIGERWRVGPDVVLQVTDPRIPCKTFATFLGERGWIRRFTAHGAPGAYLRVLVPGRVAAGDEIVVEPAEGHDVTIGRTFRALTEEHDLLPSLLACPDLTAGTRRKAAARAAAVVQEDTGGSR